MPPSDRLHSRYVLDYARKVGDLRSLTDTSYQSSFPDTSLIPGR